MLMDTKTMIPQVYGRERDIQVINKLLDIILTSCKYDIDHLGDVYDAMKCPESLLPLLGKTLNYDYNFEDTVTANRRTIDIFTLMEKQRGSEKGLLMATALSLTSLGQSQDNAELSPEEVEDDFVLSTMEDYAKILKDIQITYDHENAVITINYPNLYSLVRYLLDYVRPVGMYLILESVQYKNINADAMLLYANIESVVKEYTPEIDTRLDKSFVNFSGVVDKEWIDNEGWTYFNELSALVNEDDDTIDFNT